MPSALHVLHHSATVTRATPSAVLYLALGDESPHILGADLCWQVLYTGPMFQIYNAILRRYPREVFERFEGGGNLFATTIHVLVSAVVKISRVMLLALVGQQSNSV
jgi:hypothetical protein